MAQPNKIWKKQPSKDGRNAKQRRADKKRATRLASGVQVKKAATDLKNKLRHQSNRWLDYNLGAEDVRGAQNECRWGFKWDVQLCERLDRERADARRAAGVGPEAWVDDWFGQAATRGSAGTGDSTGVGKCVEKKECEAIEKDMESLKIRE